jgi:hypothetical protein
MKLTYFVRVSVITLLSSGIAACSNSPIISNIKEQLKEVDNQTFFCGELNGTYTVIARHHWGNIPIIRFQSLAHKEWTPKMRCEKIATRLDEFYAKGWLKYLTFDRMEVSKGLGKGKVKVPVICISPEDVPNHDGLPSGQVDLLMTLTEQDDGQKILATLKNLNKEVPEDPLEASVLN